MPKSTIGRNDPCYCGSGKKFKKCHLGSSASGRLKLVERIDVTFTADDGKVLDPRRVIMPLLLRHPGTGALQALGTCFPVFSKQNIFLTAAHVLVDPMITILDQLDGRFCIAGGYELVALWFENPEPPRVRYYLRNVVRMWRHPAADIAMGQLDGMVHRTTQNRLEDIAPTWDLRDLRKGEHVVTYAYPDIRGATTLEIVQRAHTTGAIRWGRVVEVWPSGRDKVLLPGPCFATELNLGGGMSGGPVFNRAGRLCAVNSTGYEVSIGAQPLSFMSMLDPALDIRLWSSSDPGGLTVRELIGRSFIKVHRR